MKNRQLSRLLTTLVLVAALGFAWGSDAFAAGSTRDMRGLTGIKLVKPGTGPMAGEPDVGGNSLPPPPKIGPALNRPLGSGLADWALRFHWSFRIMLMHLSKQLR